MQLFEFLREFPKYLAEKGWTLYDTRGIERLKNLEQFKDLLRKGCVQKMEMEKRYIILPLASQCDNADEVLEILEMTAEPVCYLLNTQYYPIDSLVLKSQGALLITVDVPSLLKVDPSSFLLLGKQLPSFVIGVPLLFTSLTVKEFVDTRFNIWKPREKRSRFT